MQRPLYKSLARGVRFSCCFVNFVFFFSFAFPSIGDASSSLLLSDFNVSQSQCEIKCVRAHQKWSLRLHKVCIEHVLPSKICDRLRRRHRNHVLLAHKTQNCAKIYVRPENTKNDCFFHPRSSGFFVCIIISFAWP